MFFTFSFVLSALALLSTSVSAMPQPDGELFERSTCKPGRYPDSTAVCRRCPAGNTCDGNGSPQPCQSGTYQPNKGSTTCIPTAAGYYQPSTGQKASLPCYAGGYQPYTGQAFCYGAPSGRFQGLTGQAHVCGACCGWETKLTNNNTAVYKCKGSTPYSGRASGSGCVATPQGCTPVATCTQAADGTCRSTPPISTSHLNLAKTQSMFSTFSFVSAALALLSTSVSAIPKPNGELFGRSTCDPGSYLNSTATPAVCSPCPVGNTCDGSGVSQPCQSGTYQSNNGSATCIPTAAGYYQPSSGQNASLPCPAGSYQPYPGQTFCYGAPAAVSRT
ncbi:hypothetical protein B0H13DRAFT_2647965 [Mycena leptocephala]|nr:hypothetical protein B0H13DRAFT_2647965 [Mycena leptocephala]